MLLLSLRAGVVVDLLRQHLDPLGELAGDAGQLGVLFQELEDLFLLAGGDLLAFAGDLGWLGLPSALAGVVARKLALLAAEAPPVLGTNIEWVNTP